MPGLVSSLFHCVYETLMQHSKRTSTKRVATTTFKQEKEMKWNKFKHNACIRIANFLSTAALMLIKLEQFVRFVGKTSATIPNAVQMFKILVRLLFFLFSLFSFFLTLSLSFYFTLSPSCSASATIYTLSEVATRIFLSKII